MKSALLSGALLVLPSAAHAASYKWVGPENGAWNNPAHWAPQGVPGAGDSVTITGKKKVTVPVDATVANLTVGPGAEIKNGAKIKVTGKTSSSGLFTGLGSLDIPEGGVASFNITPSSAETADEGMTMRKAAQSDDATTGTTTPAVVFAPINNKGTLYTKVAPGSRVDFASIQNAGAAQIISDGTVTFKDIKNTKNLVIGATGDLTLAKIENSAGGDIFLNAPSPVTTKTPIQGDALPTDSAPSLVHLTDLINRKGGKVKLLGDKGGRIFDGKSIRNEGDMEIIGAQTALTSDIVNSSEATLTLSAGTTLFPSDGSAPKLNNSGKLIKAAGSDATLNVELTNGGQMVVGKGTLRVRVPAGKKCKQTGGTTTLEGGVLSVEDPATTTGVGTFIVEKGVLDGIGTIQGHLTNAGGRFKPGHSPGSIIINGNFTQLAGGVLDMEVGGTVPGTGYDQILVNGIAYLGGTLNFVRWGSYVPRVGDVYTLFTYYAKIGSFAKFVDASPVPALTYSTTLTPTSYEVNCYATMPSDTTPPLVSVSTPVNGSAVRAIATATGTSSDASGVNKVSCLLYRYANPATGVAAGYWAGGSSWTPTATAANEEPAKGTTLWSITLPSMAPGRYLLRARSTDVAGNSANSATVAFWVDPTVPSVLTIDTPANGASVLSLPSVGGAISDGADGSGVVSVLGQLRRFDGLYWNGSTWSSTAFSFATTVSASRWGRSTNLPTGANLKSGKYSLSVTATDRAGNKKTTVSNFSVASVSPLLSVQGS